MGLNVLVLHNVDSFLMTLRNVADYVLCFERYAPQHRYMYHKMTRPVTPALRAMRFDAIIIDSTALGLCRERPVEKWYAEKERWSFLADSKAVKVVFPQDDYHQSHILDEVFDDWNVDIVYSVIPNHHAMLYPRSIKRSRIEVVLTGYVDDHSLRDIGKFAKPFEQRAIDLGQRVTFYWPRGGRFAQLKGRLALAAKENALRQGFRVDVSTRDEDRIFGDDWFRFLGDCRFITGCESGVSVWDPDGAIFDRVVDYNELHPDAAFEEVEQACFPSEDGKYVFSAISPRLFEAAMTGCCQILVEAPYVGALKPHDHYIPVQADLSNIAEAVAEMRDVAGAQRRAANCYEALIATPAYRYSTLTQRVMGAVEELRSSRQLESMPTREFRRLGARHDSQLVWMRRRARWQARIELAWDVVQRVIERNVGLARRFLTRVYFSWPVVMIVRSLTSIVPPRVGRYSKDDVIRACDRFFDLLSSIVPQSIRRLIGKSLVSIAPQSIRGHSQSDASRPPHPVASSLAPVVPHGVCRAGKHMPSRRLNIRLSAGK